MTPETEIHHRRAEDQLEPWKRPWWQTGLMVANVLCIGILVVRVVFWPIPADTNFNVNTILLLVILLDKLWFQPKQLWEWGRMGQASSKLKEIFAMSQTLLGVVANYQHMAAEDHQAKKEARRELKEVIKQTPEVVKAAVVEAVAEVVKDGNGSQSGTSMKTPELPPL